MPSLRGTTSCWPRPIRSLFDTVGLLSSSVRSEIWNLSAIELAESPGCASYRTNGCFGSTMSASGFSPAPASPELAAAAATPDENEDVGETPPAARTLATSERATRALTEAWVWLL